MEGRVTGLGPLELKYRARADAWRNRLFPLPVYSFASMATACVWL